MPRELYFVVGAALVVGLLIWGSRLKAKRRSRAFEQAADDLGLAFRGDALHGDIMSSLRGTVSLFDQGRRRKITNAMSGQIEDLQLHVFDYRYTTGSGRNSRTHHQTVVALHVANDSIPRFELRPERFFHKIASVLGYQDIDLEEHPTFSKRYLLRGPDEESIRALMTLEIIDHLLGAKDICVEYAGGWMALYRRHARVKPESLPSFIDEAFSISNRLL